MPRFPQRRKVPQEERSGGTVFLTWRLDHAQSPLRHEERDEILAIVRSCEPQFANLHAVVVMDDHVHALATPKPGSTAYRLAKAWKGMAAQRLVKVYGRHTPVWQRNYFDRWIDNAAQFEACVRYILQNPERRWPEVEEYRWLHIAAEGLVFDEPA